MTGLPAWMRERPELLLLPLAALLLGLNVGPWGFGPRYLVVFVEYFTFQQSNQIFPITWSLSVALFASTFVLFWRRTSLAAWRCFVVAGTVPFAAVSLYEVLGDLDYRIAYPAGGETLFDVVSILTWLAVGLTSVGWWKLGRAYVAYLAAFVGGFLLWLVLGYPTIDNSSGTRLAIAYAFNVTLKIAAFPLAAWPLWDRFGLIHRLSRGHLGSPATLPPEAPPSPL